MSIPANQSHSRISLPFPSVERLRGGAESRVNAGVKYSTAYSDTLYVRTTGCSDTYCIGPSRAVTGNTADPVGGYRAASTDPEASRPSVGRSPSMGSCFRHQARRFGRHLIGRSTHSWDRSRVARVWCPSFRVHTVRP